MTGSQNAPRPSQYTTAGSLGPDVVALSSVPLAELFVRYQLFCVALPADRPAPAHTPSRRLFNAHKALKSWPLAPYDAMPADHGHRSLVFARCIAQVHTRSSPLFPQRHIDLSDTKPRPVETMYGPEFPCIDPATASLIQIEAKGAPLGTIVSNLNARPSRCWLAPTWALVDTGSLVHVEAPSKLLQMTGPVRPRPSKCAQPIPLPRPPPSPLDTTKHRPQRTHPPPSAVKEGSIPRPSPPTSTPDTDLPSHPHPTSTASPCPFHPRLQLQIHQPLRPTWGLDRPDIAAHDTPVGQINLSTNSTPVYQPRKYVPRRYHKLAAPLTAAPGSCQERLRPDLAGPAAAPVEHCCATSRIDWRILYSADRAEGQTPPQDSRNRRTNLDAATQQSRHSAGATRARVLHSVTTGPSDVQKTRGAQHHTRLSAAAATHTVDLIHTECRRWTC
ncbi:hypothetical protein VTO73DRAFT_1595 [Trametes versicolor]